jgi:hypothetical protein
MVHDLMEFRGDVEEFFGMAVYSFEGIGLVPFSSSS